MPYPVIKILEGHDRRLRQGSPWLYSNELQIEAAKKLEPGSVVRLAAHDGRAMALAHLNPHSLIAARILTRNTETEIDGAFLGRRLARAQAIRDRLYDRPFYRLVHAEADGLPGLVIDRLGDVLTVQINTAGMAALEAEIVAVLERSLRPQAIVLRNDSPVREIEGLTLEARLAAGSIEGPVTIEENGLAFAAEPMLGQKTGWYFDQRENRAFAARLAAGQDVLDLYSYAGGFGLTALARGARSALLVDRSEDALALARAAAERQGVTSQTTILAQEAWPAIDALQSAKRRFGLVIADPPAFVRSKKDLAAGLKGYEKLARGSATLVAEAGFLCIACCSHNVPEDEFLRAAYRGIRTAGRGATLLHRAGAAADHPTHPALPESAYLKFLAFALD